MTGGRRLIVRGSYKGASGHDHHVREFVRQLARRGVRQQLVDLPEWNPVKLPEPLRDPWFDRLGEPVDAPAVLHFCMPHQVKQEAGRLHANYTMFEATRIPAAWLTHSLQHDVVIVPTPSSRDAWLDGGFPAERIRVCPLGVDPDLFRPGLEALELVDGRGRLLGDYAVRVLNVSELSPRKNLLGLLRVWIRTTSARDDAILVVKVAEYAPWSTVRLMRDLDALERTMGKARREAAPILFYQRVLADADMPRLFATATHYWSMSYGEGWDQPMMEAAAAGLRLIAPRHSAYTTYLDDSVATLIPARRVPAVFAGPDPTGRWFRGADWWEPNEEAAGQALHRALRGADADGSGARRRIASDFTWDTAAARLVGLLEELHERHGVDF